ncbi:4Fe-4S dicluster domain-containing protein, partial [Candidatus Entotheonella palauensis]|uniref:4Fe-4S dicluster domain-containing protein n=1 Tax=Candidatus Entotheonella palauensis TaxID=93172 RepID=UPI000B7ED500
MSEWAVFLCNCSHTLPIDAQQLTLPASQIRYMSHPDTDLAALVEEVRQTECRRVLISCCEPPARFEEAFAALGAQAPQLHTVNLKHDCFRVHGDTAQAYAKAERLLKAEMRSAEVRSEPAYHPLTAEGRILIVSGKGTAELASRLSRQLREVAQPIGVLAPSADDDGAAFARVYRGRASAIQGRLGDFHVRIEEANGAVQEIVADQVVVFASETALPLKTRTGCYVLSDPVPEAIDEVAARIRDLIGRFLKVVHVGYQADICAGGAANHEACGRCIPACPYEAIQRDPQRPLRIQVDHMACEGCGACVSACPTSALRYTEPSPRELHARLAAYLESRAETETPPVIVFHCGEQGRRALTAAGESGWSYSPGVLPVEVPCLRYVSAANMLTAFHMGAAGVGLLGCETCPHGERELLHQNMALSRMILKAFGLGAERLALITAAEGMEASTIAEVERIASAPEASPIVWDGGLPHETGARQGLAAAVAGLIEQTGREPGRLAIEDTQPFAVTTVRESGCTMCRSCVNVCPTHAFRFDEAAASLQLKQISCVACGLCETVCPEDVIALQPELELSRRALDYRAVVQDTIVGCSRCDKPFINQKALEAIEAKLLSSDVLGDVLGDTFAGARQSLLRMCPDCRAVAAMMEVDKGW